jgi:transcriptional regulator with XRE-family HTH domain
MADKRRVGESLGMVFRRRLRDARGDREPSVRELATRMTDALPSESRMAASTLSEIEGGKRKNVTLEEALAFAQVLNVSLARLLTPEDGQHMAPVWGAGYGPEGVRPWLATGTGFTVQPAKALTGEPLTDDERAQVEELRRRELARWAEALTYAWQTRDPDNMDPVALHLATQTRDYRVALGRQGGTSRAEAIAMWPGVRDWIQRKVPTDPVAQSHADG